jgi:hypothetical protein
MFTYAAALTQKKKQRKKQRKKKEPRSRERKLLRDEIAFASSEASTKHLLDFHAMILFTA